MALELDDALGAGLDQLLDAVVEQIAPLKRQVVPVLKKWASEHTGPEFEQDRVELAHRLGSKWAEGVIVLQDEGDKDMAPENVATLLAAYQAVTNRSPRIKLSIEL